MRFLLFYFSPPVPLSTLFVLFLSRHLYRVPYSPDAKLPRWGYIKPFIALSLDGVFRGCFARVFTFLLTLLLLTRFISSAYSKNLMPTQPSFPSLFFGFSLLTSVLRRVIFIRRMLSLGPGASMGLTGRVNAQVLQPLLPPQRWYPSYLSKRPLAICSLGPRQLHSGRDPFSPPSLGCNPSRSQQFSESSRRGPILPYLSAFGLIWLCVWVDLVRIYYYSLRGNTRARRPVEPLYTP